MTGTERANNPGIRWVCRCAHPPVLLAIYDHTGRIEVKVGDRYYIARDHLQATCPRCGTRHTLEIQSPASSDDVH